MPLRKKPGHGTDLGKTLPKALEAWARQASGSTRQKTFPGIMTFVQGPEDLLMIAKVAIPHLAVGWEGGARRLGSRGLAVNLLVVDVRGHENVTRGGLHHQLVRGEVRKASGIINVLNIWVTFPKERY